MSAKNFRFVSPGIFINEIDRSQLDRQPARMGPIIVGTSERGPGFRPTTVHSFSEFVEIFGNPIPGGEVNDVWRNGNYNGPTYGAYATQAYLKNNNPVTFVRLLGTHHDSHDATIGDFGDHAAAGWRTKNMSDGVGGAYGLFVMPSASVGSVPTAVFTATNKPTATDTLSVTFGTAHDGTAQVITFAAGAGTNSTTFSSNTATIYMDNLSGGNEAQKVGVAFRILFDSVTDYTCTDDDAGVATLVGGGNQRAQTITIVDNADNLTVTSTSGATDLQAAATGTLAAVWYIEDGYMQLKGTLYGTHTGSASDGVEISGSSAVIGNVGKLAWKAVIKDSSHNTIVDTSFSFDPDSESYVRRAFNTNPHLVNTDIYATTAGTTNYWLGQTFDRSVQDVMSTFDAETSSGTNKAFGVLVQLSNGTEDYADHRKEHIPSETGWIISQDNSSDPGGFDALDQQRAKRLFKFVSLDAGSEWNQNNIKISIEDIRAARNDNTWATFTVTLRAMDDTDKTQKILEKFANCNLNASSPNYIGRRIGDKQVTFDKTNLLLKVGGNYDNKSRYVRVKVNEGAVSKDLLPFGCYGPPRYKGFTFFNGAAGSIGGSGGTATANTLIQAGSSMTSEATASRNQTDSVHLGTADLLAGEIWAGPTMPGQNLTASMNFAALPLRKSATDGGFLVQNRAYWGVDVTKTGSATTRFNSGVSDYLKTLPEQTSADTVDFHLGSSNAECQFIFTLDDLKLGGDGVVVHVSGSRQLGPGATNLGSTSGSVTSTSGSDFLLTASTMGHDKFTTVLYGGFDGFDIKEKSPLNQRVLPSTATEKNSYAYYTVTKAIEIIKDPERVECNLLSIPGITNPNLTTRLVRIAEDRADTMAVIDIEDDFTPPGNNTNTDMANQGDVDQAVRTMKDRKIDSLQLASPEVV